MKELVHENYQSLVNSILSGSLDPVYGSATLFRIGYDLDRHGKRDDADFIYLRTVEVLESLAEPGSKVSETSLAQIAFEHGKNLETLGRHNVASIALARAVNIYDSLLETNCSQGLVVLLASALNWLALAERKSGKTNQALSTYRRTISLWRQLLLVNSAPDVLARIRQQLSTTLVGYAKLLSAIGQIKNAKLARAEAKSLLK